MNRMKAAGLICAALLMTQMTVAVARDGGGAGTYDSFPLWKDVPGRSFATLGEGKLKDRTRWAVYASRVGRGKKSHRNPCLSVASITRHGEYSDSHGCGPLVPRDSQGPPVYISISGSYQTRPDGPWIGESFMGLSFSPEVQRVKLLYASGGEFIGRTKVFNAKQQAKTGLAEFRYVAMGKQRDLCVKRVTGYSATGLELFEEDTQLC